MWIMYIVKCSDDSLYTGITTDLDRRLHEHNNTKKAAKYTRGRRPVKLVYWVQYPDRSSASKAEALFKKLSRYQKLEIIKTSELKEGDLIWQRRSPGGVCVYLGEVTRESTTRKNVWSELDEPVYLICHPEEGVIEDPSYYYEELEDQRSRHDRMIRSLTNYLDEE